MKKGKRLMIVTTVPSSLFFFFEEIIPYLKESGYQVSCVSSRGDRWVSLDDVGKRYGLKTYPLPLTRNMAVFRDFCALIKLWALLLIKRPSRLLFLTPKAGIVAACAAFLAGIPGRLYIIAGFIYADPTRASSKLYRALDSIACRMSSSVICLSRSNLEFLIRHGISRKDKTVLLANGSLYGVNGTKFDPGRVSPQRREALRRELGIPEKSVVFGYVGRLVKDKGIEDLASAWQGIRTRVPQPHLLLVGPATEPRDRLSEECLSLLDHDASVHRTGETNDPVEYYGIMDVFVLPTYREGFPNVVLEASAMSLPVITTDAIGARDSIVPSETGLLYPAADRQALEQVMDKLLGDAALRHRLGRHGRHHVLEHYNPRLSCDFLKKLLDEQAS